MVAHEGKTITPLDRRFFGAMREVVLEVLEALGDKARSLSPAGLREAAARLTEVARFADVFAANGLEPSAALEVNVELPTLEVLEGGKPRAYKRLDTAGKKQVVELRRSGKPWKEIAATVGASEGTCRTVFARASKKPKGRKAS